MDIYILRDGQESGPFSQQVAEELLKQGEVAATDFACRSGMDRWVPLSELFAMEPPAAKPEPEPEPEPASAPETTPPEGKIELATEKQKALLTYLAITLPAGLTRDQAARLVNDAMENPVHAERMAMWNEERLRLHPELFASEVQAKKENRASHFFEVCQTAGSVYFNGVTKAHCQVLVGFLDVKFPHWNARESDAAEHYFFPAVAEKFPQLVHKQWRGRLHYAEGIRKLSTELNRKSPTSQLRQTATSPMVAVVRGVFLGLFVLAILYLGYRTMHHDVTAATPADSSAPAGGKSGESATLAVDENPSAPAPAAPSGRSAVEKLPAVEPLAPVVSAEPVPVAPVPAPVPVISSNPCGPNVLADSVPAPPPAAVPAPAVAVAAVPAADPGMSPAPMASAPPPPPPAATLPGKHSAAGGIRLPTPTPDRTGNFRDSRHTRAIPADPTMAGMTPPAASPLAALPGGEPPVPVPPPPATLPLAGTLPNSPPPPAVIPATPSAPGLVMPPIGPEPPPATGGGKTNLTLTKAVEVQLQYGKLVLPPGTPVKLVSRQGATLTVSSRNGVINVPVTSTDLE